MSVNRLIEEYNAIAYLRKNLSALKERGLNSVFAAGSRLKILMDEICQRANDGALGAIDFMKTMRWTIPQG